MVFVTVIMLVLSGASPASAKHADLAGKWYTDDPASLRSELERYFNSVGNIKPVSEAVGFIVPHAGTGASGPVAAYAYKAAALRSPGTVIVIGFTHRKSFPKAAVFNEKTFTTPLGELHTDRELSEKLIAHSKVFVDYPDAFDSENSIEMQLPFIQYNAGSARSTYCFGRKDLRERRGSCRSFVRRTEKQRRVCDNGKHGHVALSPL